MDLFIDRAAERGLGSQLYDQLRDAIVDGRLRTGDRLTPSRALAAELGMSRFTVTEVYARLTAEGYTEGRAGGGTMVASTLSRAHDRCCWDGPRPDGERYGDPPDGALPVAPGAIRHAPGCCRRDVVPY